MKKHLLLFGLLGLFIMAFTPNPGVNKKKLKVPKGFVYVPSGSLKDGDKTLSIQGFFMLATEVSNLDYREFLHHLEAAGRTADLAKAQIRPEGWRIKAEYNEPMVEHYHAHPAYENYPVVNITREGALLYCTWLQEQLQSQNPDQFIKVRLPTEQEWMYAARGGHEDYYYSNGYYLRNNKGEFMYSYRHVGDEYLHTDPKTGAFERKTIMISGRPANGVLGNLTAPAQSFVPNDFGLYNMCGNAAEMIAEDGRTKGGSFADTGYDIRIDGPDTYAGVQEASPYIGFRVLFSAVGK